MIQERKRSIPLTSLLLGFFGGLSLLVATTHPLLAADGLKAPDFKVVVRGTSSGKLDIRALAPAGHHFNLDAPMYFAWQGAGGSSTRRIAPLKRDHLALEFLVSAQNSPRDFEISAYLCDDRNTYCERHSVRQTAPASVASRSSGIHQPKVAAGTGAPDSDSDKHVSARAREFPGFVMNDAARAFREARATHRLVMIDFFAIWCPPCNELDEHVFSARGFLKSTSAYVRLKLDVDSPVSWRWKAKYGIQGYPTVVFATPEGDELGRVVGFRPLATFLADAKAAADHRDDSFTRLRVRARAGDHAAAGRLGLMEFDRGNWAEAGKYFALSGETKLYGEPMEEARIALLDDGGDSPHPDPRLISALESSIRDYPDTPDSIDRRMRLADLYGDRKDAAGRKAVLEDAVRAARLLMSHPEKLENKDCTRGDLWEDLGEAYEDLGEATRARAAYRSGVKEYRGLMHSQNERGYSLELAFCLWKSGDAAGAEQVYRRFEKLYPGEFTFFFNHARMYHALGQDARALALARSAYARSYGDNRLRSGKLLADILEARGQRAQAIAAAKKALSDVRLPASSSLRAHRYARQLQEMIEKLGKS